MLPYKLRNFFYNYNIDYFQKENTHILVANKENGDAITTILKSEAELYAYMYGYAAAIGEIL